jgi:predicted Na+-dependent transporter
MIPVMEFTEFLGSIGVLSVFIFIISSMISMGLKFSMNEIVSPLKNLKLDLIAIIVNFILAPIVVSLIVFILPLSQGLSIGLILLSCAAGAPFIPKLVQIGKGNVAYSISLMVLLMVFSIIFLPIALPLILQGVSVNPLDIAKPLVLLMLCPLIIAMLFKMRYSDISKEIEPFFSKVSNLAMFVLIVSFLVVYFNQITGVIGTTAIIASIAIILILFAIGFLLGGKEKSMKFTLGVASSQRNLAAAFAIATTNFNDPEVLTMLIVFGLIGLLIIMPLSAEIGKKKS